MTAATATLTEAHVRIDTVETEVPASVTLTVSVDDAQLLRALVAKTTGPGHMPLYLALDGLPIPRKRLLAPGVLRTTDDNFVSND